MSFAQYEVDQPSGGKLTLHSAEEVQLWNKARQQYMDDYMLTKVNDKVLLGVLLQQQINIFRAQQRINGMTIQLDQNGYPTGNYEYKLPDMEDMSKAVKLLTMATDQLRSAEKQLGIDKASRESGGHYNLAEYLTKLKRAAHMRGIHISKRVLAMEAFFNELSVKLRLLYNVDAEDRAYHQITPENICKWANEEVGKIHDMDKQFAQEKGKVFVGQL
jgi:hypothetical protein